jgi:hypothetical protein
MRRQRVTATVLALGLVAGACSTTLGVHSHDASRLTEVTTTSGALSTVSTSVADTTPGGSTASVPTPSLHWVNCGNDLDCASMAAPLDYSNPSLGSVTIKITRHRALQPSGRIG